MLGTLAGLKSAQGWPKVGPVESAQSQPQDRRKVGPYNLLEAAYVRLKVGSKSAQSLPKHCATLGMHEAHTISCLKELPTRMGS